MATGTKSSSFSNLVASWTKRFFVRSRSLPIAVGVALLTTTLILWQALLAQERADIEQAIQLEASNANFQITRQLQERTQALERMAKRWEYSGKPPKDYWEADAKLYVENFSGFQAIEWVDPSFYVGWIVPMKGNEAVQNLYLGFEPRRKMALEAARNQRQTVGHAHHQSQAGRQRVPGLRTDLSAGRLRWIYCWCVSHHRIPRHHLQ
jgi:sensor domain CHASE-containing protein